MSTPPPPAGAPRRPASPAIQGSWALLVGIGLLMLGNGLQGSLLGVRATQEGFGSSLIGLIMSGFFVGFLLGSVWAPRAVRTVGHVRTFAALASLASVSILAHALLVDPLVWGVMRFVTGFCYAGIFVVAESWLNDRTSNANRGQLLAVYMATIFLGMGGGQLMLNLADPGGADLFIAVSALISLAVLPILLSASPAPEAKAPRPVSLARLYRVSPLGTFGTFAAGIVNGTIFGMGAVYARETGLSVADTSLFMGALIAGAAALQWPIGKLSDLFDRRNVITLVTLAAAATALLAGQAGSAAGPWLFLAAAVLGGFSLTIHSLCIAYTHDYLDPAEMVAASSGLVLVLGAGSILGPLAVGPVIGTLGPSGFFWWLALVHLGLAAFALWRMTRRAPQPSEEQGSFMPAPTQTGSLAPALAPEEAGAPSTAGEAEPRPREADAPADPPEGA